MIDLHGRLVLVRCMACSAVLRRVDFRTIWSASTPCRMPTPALRERVVRPRLPDSVP